MIVPSLSDAIYPNMKAREVGLAKRPAQRSDRGRWQKNAGQSSQIRRDRRKTARPGPSGPAN